MNKLIIFALCVFAGNLAFGASGTAITNTSAGVSRPDLAYNVQWAGIMGDNATDHSAALAAVLSSNSLVYFPAGTYITQPLILTNASILFGQGGSSVIKLKSGSAGYAIRATNCAIELRDLRLSGGDLSRPVAAGSRHGVSVHTYWGGKIQNCSIGGFTGNGISLDGVLAQMDIGPQTIVESSQIYYCGTGIKTGGGTPGGEYTTIVNNVVNSNLIGAEITAGNVIVNANQFTGNAVALVYGDDGNGGHGVLSANLINHNDIGVIATNMPHSMSIIGNQSWYGAWYLTNCTKPMFIGNTLHSGIYLDSSSAVFSHNWFQSGILQTSGDASEFYFNLGLTNRTPSIGIGGRLTTSAFSVIHGAPMTGGLEPGLHVHYTNDLASIESLHPGVGYKPMQVAAQYINFKSGSTIVGLMTTNGFYTSGDAWHAPTFENGWENSGGGYASAKYIWDSAIIVRLRGLIKGPDFGVAFTLPEGYRPASICWHTTTGTAGHTDVTINPAGQVNIVAGTTNGVSLDGIAFRID